MAIHLLSPAFVRIEYQSAYAPHVMIRPTRAWTGTPFSGDAGDYEAWDTTPVASDTMIEAFIDAMLPLYLPTVTFSSYTIFTQSAVLGSLPVPVYSKNLTGKVGTSISTGWDKATQRTYSYLSSGNFNARLVLLDTPVDNAYDRVTSIPPGAELSMVNLLMSDTAAWAARDDTQLIAFRQLAVTLNEKLRREYHMT